MLGPKSGTADHFVTNPDQIWDSPDPRSCHHPAHPPTIHLPPLTHNLAKYKLVSQLTYQPGLVIRMPALHRRDQLEQLRLLHLTAAACVVDL